MSCKVSQTVRIKHDNGGDKTDRIAKHDTNVRRSQQMPSQTFCVST